MNDTNKPTILVTGGAGYIGSHMCVELLQSEFNVVVVDNLCNSSSASVEAVQRITQKPLTFVEGDICDQNKLDEIFRSHPIEGVLHFAGLKAVGESNEKPLAYYKNNIYGTMNLVESMARAGCKTLVFSSSATVYGTSENAPFNETEPTSATNPYGRTKLMVEQFLQDLHASDPEWRISLLRYFNPVGAHPSGEIGEDPNQIPNNLMPYISQVAVGKLPHLNIFGDDYPTPDGTGVRDYVHVVDLVRGHLKAMEHLADEPKLAIHNLGTGQGYSVLDVVHAFEKVSGVKIPYKIAERRPGDVAQSFADPAKANEELDWSAEYDLERMCEDAWRWQHNFPDGFAKAS